MRKRLLTLIILVALVVSFSAVTTTATTGEPCKPPTPCWKKELKNGKTENTAEEKYFTLTLGAADIRLLGDKGSALVTIKLMAPGKDPAKDAYDYDHTYLVADGSIVALSQKSPAGLLKSGSGWRVDLVSYSFANQPPSTKPLSVEIWGSSTAKSPETIDNPLVP